jgi:hypothetical protein
MAKSRGGKSKGGKDDMVGPLYSKPDGYELGPHRVEGPHGGLVTPDPLSFAHGTMRHGPGGQQRKQSHEKD